MTGNGDASMGLVINNSLGAALDRKRSLMSAHCLVLTIMAHRSMWYRVVRKCTTLILFIVTEAIPACVRGWQHFTAVRKCGMELQVCFLRLVN